MYIHIKIFPGSKRERIEKRGEHHFFIYTREKAERNQANKALKRILASHFNTSEKNISLISGHHRSSKIVRLREYSMPNSKEKEEKSKNENKNS